MDSSCKIFVLGSSTQEPLFSEDSFKPHHVQYLSISTDLTLLKEQAPHIIVLCSPDTDSVERVLQSMGKKIFRTEPVFLLFAQEGHRDAYEKLWGRYPGADYIAEPLTQSQFNCKIRFLCQLARCRSENEALREMVRKSRFAGHEINNPLTSIIGNAEMLLDEELDGLSKKMISIIRSESLRISRLVEEFMESSR